MKYNYIALILLICLIPITVSAEVTQPAWGANSPYRPIVDPAGGVEYAAIRDYGIESTAYGSASADFTLSGGPNYHEYVLLKADIHQRPDSNTTFSLTTYNGVTFNGEIGLTPNAIPGTYTLWVDFNGNETIADIFLLWYLSSDVTVSIMAVMNYDTNSTGFDIETGGLFSDAMGYEDHDLRKDPWGKIVISSTDNNTESYLIAFPIDYYFDYSARPLWEEEENVVWQLFETFITIGFFLLSAWDWIYFIILNLPMLMAIAEVGVMFYALSTSSSIFTAIKRWWTFNENTLHFFVAFFEQLINIVKAIKDTIPILRWL